tara:strand:- start:7 stop:348 length:342 start_codon:yes stop_codon:yes gene_type:complete
MKQFSKYEFLTELRQDLICECENLYSRDADENEIQDSLESFVHSYIDNKCIYYADCWTICYELASSDFEIEQTGETAKNITELAYWSLYDLSYSIDIDLLIESVKPIKQNNNK